MKLAREQKKRPQKYNDFNFFCTPKISSAELEIFHCGNSLFLRKFGHKELLCFLRFSNQIRKHIIISNQNKRNDFHFNSASIFDDSFMVVVIVVRERERKKTSAYDCYKNILHIILNIDTTLLFQAVQTSEKTKIQSYFGIAIHENKRDLCAKKKNRCIFMAFYRIWQQNVSLPIEPNV